MIDVANILKLVMFRCWELLKVPFLQRDMLWIITPIVIIMVLMSLYFGRYKKEELGWNTAFGNSMVLIFVSVDLMRHLYDTGDLFSLTLKTALVLAVIIEGIFLSMFSYFHILGESFAFGLNSGITINTVALFAIILTYSNIPLDFYTAGAVAFLAIVLFTLMKIVEVIQEGVDDDNVLFPDD